MNYRFDHPVYLWLLLLAVPMVWLGVRSLATFDATRRWTAIVLRCLVLILLVFILAGLQAVQRHSDLTVVAVVDQSESVRRFAKPPTTSDPQNQSQQTIGQWTQTYLKKASINKETDDRFALVTYDGRPSVRSLPSAQVDIDDASLEDPLEGTDTASAIRLAMALFPADSGKRMVLVSDGNDTARGHDLLEVAREAKAAGIPIDVLPLQYNLENEVMVEGVYAPTEAREGQTVALRVVLRAARPTAGSLYLNHDQLPVDLNGDGAGMGVPVLVSDWTVEQEEGLPDEEDVQTIATLGVGRHVCVRLIELPLALSGTNHFEAIFEPNKGSDSMSANNRAEAFTLVQGKGRVLFLDNIGAPHGLILPNALKGHGIELDVLPGHALPSSLVALQRYDAVILQNVPAEMMTPAQQRMLSRYVHDLGGGLIMIGGPDSFGAGGWTNSPIDEILPVECQIPSQTILPSGALVLVLDRSGSMASPVSGTRYTQQEVANEAAILALNTLYPQDMVGVVAFDTSAQWVAQLQENRHPQTIAKHIRSIYPGGGTDLYTGLQEAYDALKGIGVDQAAVKHIILLTDGESQPGDSVAMARKLAQAEITLSTVGVGDAQNSQLLHSLAQMTGGQFYSVSNPKSLPQVFIKEARTIRKNLIKEKTFHPQLVSTGSPIMVGIEGLPDLHGMVLTGEKRKLGVFMPVVGAEGEPIFAHWQVGLGRSAAFTSDATNRWATDWLQWGGYIDFWSRTIRAIARPTVSRDFDLVTSIHGQTLHVRLDAVSDESTTDRKKGGGFSNFLQIQGMLLEPDGKTVPVTLTQTGPGVYETQMPAKTSGNYIVSLFIDQPGDSNADRFAVFGGVSKPSGNELRRFRSNSALLEQVAQITGGRVLAANAPKPPVLFTREVPFESRSIRPLWRTLLVWLLILFLLDVACRRVAWDLMATIRWVREHVLGFSGRFRTRQAEAVQTLGALKRHAAERQAQASQTASANRVEPPAKNRKFEAPAGTAAPKDFAEAVGGAKIEKNRPVTLTTKKATQEKTSDDGPTTSRLLDAKRRARKRIDEQEE